MLQKYPERLLAESSRQIPKVGLAVFGSDWGMCGHDCAHSLAPQPRMWQIVVAVPIGTDRHGCKASTPKGQAQSAVGLKAKDFARLGGFASARTALRASVP